MPLYLYEVVLPDGTGGEVFEVLQPMRDPPLAAHPESGEPVRRVFGAPNAPKGWTDSQGKAKLTDNNLDKLGFTKYVKAGDGRYEKTAGKGPSMIRKDRDS